ncbi:beta-1,6-N-acetylglucosaminyltransferase [uncultured Pseudokineococcus sp.]|uniref:beta-1,6-N-acetylglucosaminyltransferase n=1 Tax=uncultured Pseudokineococcus sp. TaxID=1642928 RepID=UPI00262C1F7E|nr:beta-1,6-N-acetylglucosaminyltransferase [uncultured Pseudokineococcus sp.]
MSPPSPASSSSEGRPRARPAGPVVVGVLSHRDAPLLRRLVDRLLDGEETVVLVHHDPRGPELDLPRSDRVLLARSPVECRWGRPSLARAVLGTATEARDRVPELSWFLLVSGQDYPCRPIGDIERELASNDADAYLRWFEVPTVPGADEHPWQAVTRRRYLHRRRLPRSHRSLPLPRRHPFDQRTPLVVGDMWVNLGRRALDHLIEQRARRPELERYLMTCSVPDEAVVTTLLHDGAEGLRVVGDRRRYIRWVQGEAHPAVLGLQDLEAISTGGDFFARKVDGDLSRPLLDALDARAQR